MTILPPLLTKDSTPLLEALLPFFPGPEPDAEKRSRMAAYLAKMAEPSIRKLLEWLLSVDSMTTEGLYDQVALFYDLAFPDHRPATEFLDLLEKGEAAGKVVDLGCGTGESIRPLLEIPAVTSIVGIDISRAMLGLADQKLARVKGAERLQFLRGSFLKAPPEEALGADLLLAASTARHCPLEAEEAFFTFVARCLRPGGVALIEFLLYSPDPSLRVIDQAVERWMQSKGIADRRFGETVLSAWFEAVGLRVLRTERRPSRYLYEKLLVKAVRS